MRFQQGFSLVELLIVVGLLGGVSLVTMKLIEIQKGNEAFIKASAEVEKATTLITKALNNPRTCRQMLGNALVNNPTPQFASLKIEKRNRDSGALEATTVLLSANANYGDFYLKDYPSKPSIDLISHSTPPQYELVLRFRIKPISLLSWGAKENVNDKEIVKKIPLFPSLDKVVTNKVVGCIALVSESNDVASKNFCDSLGTNMATWNGTKCVLRSLDCDPGFVPADFDRISDLRTSCVPANTKIRAEDLFNIDPGCNIVNGFRIVNNSGKFTVVCY